MSDVQARVETLLAAGCGALPAEPDRERIESWSVSATAATAGWH